MIPDRVFLLLGACAAVSGSGVAVAAPPGAPPIAVAPPVLRPVPPRDWPPPPPPRDRPRMPGLEVVGGPDWSDPDIYPLAARAQGQEGPVSFELIVGTDGRPQSCAVTSSSGYAELDRATCGLGMRMRFARPQLETRVPFRVVWMLSPEAIPFEAQRMVAALDLAGGSVVGCTLSGTGGLVDDWRRVACRTFALEAEYYLGARRWTSRRATVVVELLPEAAALPPLAGGAGYEIAVRRTDFEVDADGDPRGCRTVEDRGFGRPRIDHADACGFFLSRGHTFAEAEEDAPPRRGRIEVRVLAEPAPRPRSRRR